MRHLCGIVVLCALLASCQFGEQEQNEIPEDPVAEVDGVFLSESELEGIGQGLPKEDSIAMVDYFIEEWITEQLLVQKAKEVMPADQLDFEKQLRDYENDLILEAYFSELKVKADTTILQGEMVSYYEEQKENYLLNENLYRINFVRIPSSSPVIDSIYNWLLSDEEGVKVKIANRAESFGGAAMLDDSLWLGQENLLSWYPVEAQLLESYEVGSVKVYFKDGNTYLLKLHEVVNEGDYIPFSYKKEEIRGILVARRKRNYIESTMNKVFEEGKNQKRFTIYK